MIDSITPFLQKSYRINYDSLNIEESSTVDGTGNVTSIPNLTKTLTVLEAVLKVIITMNNGKANSDTNYAYISVASVEQVKSSLLRSITGKRYKQAVLTLTGVFNDYLFSGSIRPDVVHNITVKYHLIELFKIYFAFVEKVLVSESEPNNSDKQQDFQGIAANFSENYDQIFRNIAYFFINIGGPELFYSSTNSAVSNSLKTGNAKSSIYGIDPILMYLPSALKLKFGLDGSSSLEQIKSNIEDYFSKINFYEFNTLRNDLIEENAIQLSLDVVTFTFNNESTSTDSTSALEEVNFRNYIVSRLASLVTLVDFYVTELCYMREESVGSSGTQIIEFIETNPFTAVNRSQWIDKYKQGKKLFENKKREIAKQRQKQAEVKEETEEQAEKYRASSKSDHVNSNGTSATKPETQSFPTFNNADRLVNERKQQIYKKFSRRHPHINMNHKLSSTEAVVTNTSETSTNTPSFTSVEKRSLDLSADNSLLRNLRILIVYNLSSLASSRKFKVIFTGFLLNFVILLVALKSKNRLRWLRDIKKRIWK